MFVLAAALATGCGSEQLVTQWSVDSVAVDGKMTEWVESPLTRLKDTGMRMALRNDDETMYVLLCCTDVASVRSIQTSGITVWLDASGKKKKEFGIRFRGGPSMEDLVASGLVSKDDMPQGMASGTDASSGGALSGGMTPSGQAEGISPPPHSDEQSQEQSLPRVDGRAELAFVDKKNNKTTIIAAEGKDGPAAKCGAMKGLCLYEFSIPLGSDDSTDVVFPAGLGAKMGVGFAWGGAPEGQRSSDGGRGGGGEGMGPGGGSGGGFPRGGERGGPGGMPPGGPGGGAGGGPAGGPGGSGRGPGGGPGAGPGSSQSGPQFAEKQEIWLNTSLAIPPAE